MRIDITQLIKIYVFDQEIRSLILSKKKERNECEIIEFLTYWLKAGPYFKKVLEI